MCSNCVLIEQIAQSTMVTAGQKSNVKLSTWATLTKLLVNLYQVSKY